MKKREEEDQLLLIQDFLIINPPTSFSIIPLVFRPNFFMCPIKALKLKYYCIGHQKVILTVANCGGSPRKRGTEVGINQLMSTLHQQQLIDLSRNAGVNTGLRLAFSDQQNSLSPPQLYLMSKDLSTQIHQQRYEIDHFLQLQGEELRRTLAEKWRRQNYALLEAAEVSVSRRLKEKDDEAEKAVWRKAELEARAAQLRMEAEVWKARATTQEAEAVSLQVQLQHAIFSSGGSQGCGSGGETEDAESAAYIDPERVVVMVRSGPGCKACGKGVASVVLLPCRHLCVCGECEGVVLACPLCLSLRTSSVQVYMS